jgi:hypothetical protein
VTLFARIAGNHEGLPLHREAGDAHHCIPRPMAIDAHRHIAGGKAMR